MRWPQARYSRDVDLLRTCAEGDVDDAVAALVAAAAVELDDHLTFDHHDTSAESAIGRPTRKVRFRAMFGLRQLAMVSVDVVATEFHPCDALIVEPLTAPFDISSDPWPDVRMWPLEDHVADKIAAMYERHRSARLPSTRYKDLVDLVLIAVKSSVAGRLAHLALHNEVRRRREAGIHVILPTSFEVPGRSWTDGYRAQARNAHDLPPAYVTLGGAMPLADAFVTPLLQSTPPPGDWSPDRQKWA